MKVLGSFQTIEHFWRIYDHMIRANDFKSTTDYHIFKDGIKPTWEGINLVLGLYYYYYYYYYHALNTSSNPLSTSIHDTSASCHTILVGRSCQQARRQMDGAVEEGIGQSLLGRHRLGHRRRAVRRGA